MKRNTIEDVYGLSPMQSGMLFHTLYATESCAYLDQVVYAVEGELNTQAFDQAWVYLLSRHPVLRTSFHWEEVEEPLQIVHSAIPRVLHYLDWSNLSECEQQSRLADLLAQDRALGVTLSEPPLMRLTLISTGSRSSRLLWTFHHMLLDRWSVSLVLSELKTAYRSILMGHPIDLPSIRPYSDYIGWLQEQDKQKAEIYWRKTLLGREAPTALPIDRSPGELPGRDLPSRKELLLSEESSSSLQALARRHRLTLNTLIQGAWALLLSIYSGNEDVMFGGTVSGRPPSLHGVEQIVGLFINSLPVRIRVPNKSLLPWFGDLQNSLLELREYEFCSLVEIQRWSEIPRGLPLFDSLVVVQNAPIGNSLSDESALDLRIVDSTSSVDFPLMMLAIPGPQLRLVISFDPCRFEISAIDRLLGHYETLLECIVADIEQRVSHLTLLTQSEREQLLGEWNDTRTELPSNLCLHQRIEDQVERSPDAVAVCFENESLTYSQLDRRANQLAHYLRQQGVGPDVLVGLCVERSVEMVVGLLGILKAGGAYVPLDPSYPAERLEHMRGDAGMSVVLTQQALLPVLPPWDGTVLCLDTDWQAISREGDQRPASCVDPDNLAYVIYTSGSTGKPKGAMNSHRAICNRLLWMQDAYRLSSSDRVLQKTPYSFDVSVWEFFWPLMVGARLVLAAPELHRDASGLVELVKSSQITTLHFVPSMLQVFLQEAGVSDCTSIRRVICSGEALPASMVNQFGSVLPAELHNLYGPTEAAVDVSYWHCPTDGSVEMVPIGRPVWNTQLYVLDRSLSPVPVGIPGELYLGGVQLARGYLNRADLTAERFVPDPFSAGGGARLYKTGDLVRFLPDGNIEYLGRLDHQAKIRGFRIELGEIESALLQHPGVQEAVVLAREDSPGDKRLAAYIGTSDSTMSASRLREHLLDKLPGYMVPSAFVFLNSLPLNPNGKVDRKALPAPDSGRRDIESDFAPPRNEIEESLVRIWGEVLRIECVGIHDNYFELGGDSILSIQIIARANQAGLKLTPRQVFKHQTIAGLAAVIGTELVTPNIQDVNFDSPVPLIPIQDWFFERDLPALNHFNQAQLLVLRQRVPADHIEQVCRLLVEKHDALRFRFTYGAGSWQQTQIDTEQNSLFTCIDLSGLPDEDRGLEITLACTRLQSSLNVTEGPLLHVAYFDMGLEHPARLFIVIHHLVVDGVSWTALLSDLSIGLEQLERGETASLTPQTTSFRLWAQRLHEYAQSKLLLRELNYWLSGHRLLPADLPVDFIEGLNAVASQFTLDVSLSVEETRALLKNVPAVYHTQINDVLLSALVESVGNWVGECRILIDVEGHGREHIFDDVDLSGTVGWFTTLFPLTIELPPSSDPGEILKAVKEQLRRVPNRGIGYGLLRYMCEDSEVQRQLRMLPRAQVTFNYLGQTDRDGSDTDLFGQAPESAGQTVSRQGLRSHELGVLSQIREGRLQVAWIFSEQVLLRPTVERLAASFLASLRAIIAHCQSSDAGGYTPSDFPRARLTQKTLDRLPSTMVDVYGLSPMQSGMLFHSLYAIETGVYLDQIIYALDSDLDIEAFEQAWQYLIIRNPVLRSSFHWESVDEPIQVVHKQASVTIQHLDWSQVSDSEQCTNLVELLESDRDLGIELSRPPLLRLTVARTGGRTWKLLLTYHHLLLDRWSVSLLISELKTTYHSISTGLKIDIPATGPYSEYIGWLQDQDKEKAESYWRRLLAGIEAPTAFPIDRSPGDLPGRELPSRQDVLLSEETTSGLMTLVRRQRLTLNTLIQGAWAVLLSRYCGTEDVMFGSTVSGRPGALRGVEQMVGLFINSLPVRVKAPGESLLLPWLEDLQEKLLELREYEYSSLVDVQGWSDIPRGVPLFDSLVVVQNTPERRALRNDGLDLRSEGGASSVDFPLLLVVTPGAQLRLVLSYDSVRFENAAISRLLGHFSTLMKSMIADPEAQLSRLPMLTDLEHDQLLVEWNATGCEYPRERCMHELVEEQALRTPDAVAVTFEAGQLTYGALNRQANQLAHTLRKHGVGPEALVGVFAERSIEMVVGLLAILKAGGAYVPLDPSYPPERLAFMLEDTQTTVLLTQARLQERLTGQSAQVICMDSDVFASEQSEYGPSGGVTSDNLAYVIYTSGSTGRPKGVEICHRNLLNLVNWHVSAYTSEEALRSTQVARPAFDASVWEIWPCLVVGATLCIANEETMLSAPALVEWLRDNAAEVCFLPTPMAEIVLEEASCKELPLRTMLTGGDRLHHPPRQALPFTLVNHYGPTECTVVSTAGVVHPDKEAASPSIGRPISNTRIYILNCGLEPTPVGVAGEIYIGGASVARGYLNRPELTAERFIPDPFGNEPGERLYRTGDLARYLADGTIDFLGRADDQVKIRGFRIELGEIESVLLTHPQVYEAVVVAREDRPGEKRLAAYIGRAEGAPSASLLREYLLDKLPAYMAPSAFVFMESLPLTPNGKVDRKALPAPEMSSQQEDTYVAPRTPIEQGLAEIWCEVLHLTRVGIHDSFFDLGGHSLMATQVMSRVRNTFQIELPLRVLFEEPTIARLAIAMTEFRETGDPESAPLVRVSRNQSLPLSYAQQRLWLAHRLDSSNPAYNVPCVLRVSGDLSRPDLQRAIELLVDRHEILRTTYSEKDGLPVQEICSQSNVPFSFVDSSALRDASYEAILKLAVTDTKSPFDLGAGPVARAMLYRLSDTDHVLSLTLHHIVADGWSMSLLIKEVIALYDGLVKCQPNDLENLPVQYADYAVWQRQQQESRGLQEQTGYWRGQLAGISNSTTLPFDRPRPMQRSLIGATISRELNVKDSDGLRSIAREENATLFMVLLACYKAALYSLNDEEDVVVGTDIAGRNRVELEGLLGFFVNNLVLRTNLSGNPTIRELISRVRRTALDAYTNQDVPLDTLVDLLRPERDPSYSPLFQVLFVMQNTPSELPNTSAIWLEPAKFDTCTSKFDLALFFREREQDRALVGHWVFPTDVFDAVTVRQIAERFETVVSLMILKPETRISELKDEILAAATERRRQQRNNLESRPVFQRSNALAGIRADSPGDGSAEDNR